MDKIKDCACRCRRDMTQFHHLKFGDYRISKFQDALDKSLTRRRRRSPNPRARAKPRPRQLPAARK